MSKDPFCGLFQTSGGSRSLWWGVVTVSPGSLVERTPTPLDKESARQAAVVIAREPGDADYAPK